MTMFRLDDLQPRLPDDPDDCWIADNATVIGNVELRPGASVWFNTVIRGDNEPIVICEGANVQDGCVLHTDPGFPMTIGPRVTVGHMVMLHGCTIGEDTLIGIGSILLNGSKIGRNCIIGAGALVPEGKVIPDNSVVFGTPGKIVRETTEADRAHIKRAADNYEARWKRFRKGLSQV